MIGGHIQQDKGYAVLDTLVKKASLRRSHMSRKGRNECSKKREEWFQGH